MRALYDFFGLAEQLGMNMEVHAWLCNFYENVALTQFVKHYKAGMNELNQQDEGKLSRYLKHHGYVPTQKRFRATHWNNSLKCILQLQRGNDFRKVREQAEVLHHLVRVFGHGILCLLPENGVVR